MCGNCCYIFGPQENVRTKWGPMKRSFLLFAVFFAAFATWAQEKTPQTPPSPPPPVVSPEVHHDNRVVFRLRAPSAKEVTVSIEGSTKPLPVQKDDQGIWSVTSEPLAPDFYGYSFQVDGVGMLDPSNYRIKPNFLYRGNEVHVPGPASLAWETGDVKHGELHRH